MRQLDDQSSNSPSAASGSAASGSAGSCDSPSHLSPNAFSADFLAELSRRDPAPATPEADTAGPWRVTSLYGAGDPRWACLALGEPRPRLTLRSPDLAYLTAAALAVAEGPPAFRFQEGADARLHLLWHGHPVGTAPTLIRRGGDNLPVILGALADLRVQPLAFAHYLLSVPDETLRRSGRILMELLHEAGR